MSLAALTVKIGADLTELNKGLADAGKGVSDLGRQVSASGGQLSGNLTAPLREASKAAGEHHLALGRINQALEGLAAEALGANSRLAGLATKFAEFGVGGPIVAGILAGLAAIALGWEKITESSREADKATAEAIKTLEKIREKRLLGPGGEALAATRQARDIGLPVKRFELATLEDGAKKTDPLSPAGLKLALDIANKKAEIANLLRDIQEGSEEVTKNVNEDAENRARKAVETLEKEKAAGDRFLEAVGRMIGQIRQAQRDLTTFQGELIDKKNPLPKLTTGMKEVREGPIPGFQFTGDAIFRIQALSSEAARKLNEAGIRLTVSADELHKAAVKNLALGELTGLLSQHGGTFGGILSGAINGAIATKSPIGALIGGGAAIISALFNHKSSVERNTNALNHLSEVMGAPQGFKVDPYRYRARLAEEEQIRQRGGNGGWYATAGVG